MHSPIPPSLCASWCRLALAAWLTAASIVNIAASLKYHGLAGAEPSPIVTTVMIVIGAAIADGRHMAVIESLIRKTAETLEANEALIQETIHERANAILRWTGLDPDHDIMAASLQFNTADSVEAFIAASRGWYERGASA